MSTVELRGATALVTGGSRGIGPHIARELAQRGVRVAIAARTASELEAHAARMAEAGLSVAAFSADVTEAAQRRDLVARVQRKFGPVDILVNNAGGDPQREFHKLTEEEVEDVLALNLTGAVVLTRLVLPGMLDRKKGHIVNVSSMAGRVGFPFTEPYAAGKDGMIGFTRVLRGDYRRRGVSATALILGPIRGDGVGARTAEEFDLKLPAVMASAESVAKAAVRAITRDRAEVVVMPGPGKAMRAFMDRFPAAGLAMNRMSGSEKTMRAVIDHREQQAQLALGQGAP
jgi:short-subunit dehydrogenase